MSVALSAKVEKLTGQVQNVQNQGAVTGEASPKSSPLTSPKTSTTTRLEVPASPQSGKISLTSESQAIETLNSQIEGFKFELNKVRERFQSVAHMEDVRELRTEMRKLVGDMGKHKTEMAE